MSVRNLDFLFKPSSITLIGGDRRARSVGAVVARNLFNAGFDGPVMPIHPDERSIEGALCYKSVEDLPITADLAVICTPDDTWPGLIDQLGRRGTKAAVIVAERCSERSDDGLEPHRRILDAARPHLLRISGPNGLGVMVPARGLNASMIHVNALKGDLAFVAQSGAVVTSVVDWATSRGIGFSHVISLGDMADVDLGDLLDYLAADPGTRAILLYIEAITAARKFMSAGRTAARQKPVVVIKAGVTAEGARVAASHAGALAGSDAVYDAALRRAGMLRVGALNELFDAVETLAMGLPINGDRLAILTNGGGIGILATDTLTTLGGHLARLQPETVTALDQILPAAWSHANPVGILADAKGKRYADSLTTLLDDRANDAVLVLNCPSAVGDSADAAQAVIATLKGRKHPVLTSWLGEGAATDARRQFAAARIPSYDTPDQAVRAFMHLVQYRKNHEMLMQTPTSVPEQFDVDGDSARIFIEAALAEGRSWLTEFEAKQVLQAYRIPVVDTRKAVTPDEAMQMAREIGKPVALKILSPDIPHKTDVGGVALHITTPEEVRAKAESMLARIRRLKPDAQIDGFTVQEMATKPGALELIIGVSDDPTFGPVILVGEGGLAVEVIRDHALGLPPLNANLAREMIQRTRIYNLLRGYRDQPAADIDAIILTLLKVSQLVTDFGEVLEIDINPLLVDDVGVLALDAGIKVAALGPRNSRRLAIRPYPKKLEQTRTLSDGQAFLLRPVRPEDEPLVQDMFEQMTPEDIRLRFFAPIKRMSHQMAARLTQLDYDREMALCAVAANAEGNEQIYGVVRVAADPDNQRGEYAIMVRSDMKGKGLGFLLMSEIIVYARSRGIHAIFGEVLRENTAMLQMCHDLGFTRRENTDEPGVVEVQIKLQ
ncbi:MAG: bifunctional acetate--CoA ligase family protein/GNAT family N-acetyltransferase [Azospirillaceae bacterium]|nr:bifunctional acetate--CoA ligase family protein/GNAT family N-acetyltransferase [Azospirillaceae bacterium]